MISYDPNVIQKCVSQLYARAAISTVTSAVLGGLIGLVAAPYLKQALPAAFPTAPDWVFALILGILGLGQGLEKACQLKLQAQTALCQLQIERNTRVGGGAGSSP